MDENKVNNIIDKTYDDVQFIKEVTDEVVSAYTQTLDEVMKAIQTEIVSIEDPALVTIEKYFLELTNTLYFVNARVEELSIYDGISKASLQEAYNNTYLSHQLSTQGITGAKKPTVADSTATAENAVINETAVNILYNRAYKIVKAKVDSAQTMVNTLNKIMSLKIQELSLSSTNTDRFMPDGRKVLNENYRGET